MKHAYPLAALHCAKAFGTRVGRLLPGGLGLLLLLLASTGARAQQQRPAPVLFQEDVAARNAAARSPLAAALRQSRPLTLDATGLQAVLATAPLEGRGAAPILFAVPLPDGSTGTFRVVESPVMEPGLAAQFPGIKTYSGVGVDDPTASIRLDVTPRGFHAQVLSANGTVYIDPVSQADQQHYLSFYHKDMQRPAFVCGVSESSAAQQRIGIAGTAQRTVGATLRTFRLAMAATGEYTAFHGGTVALGQAAIVTTVNRVVGVYERELAVRMVLVANNSQLVYTNASTDPFTNTSSDLNGITTTINTVIGAANYDIGHLVGTGGGGVAGLRVVCGSSKGRGLTGSPSPVGDAFDIDYVAHEIGHQFGGNHTFNSPTGNCGGGNRNASTAYEPGSGSTIMAYAGICGSDDLQPNSDPFFHVVSFEEISAFVGTITCGTTTATGNTAPTITSLPISGKVIPISTPFKLTAGASDAEGDALTYNWEEYDLGPSATLTAAQVANQSPPIFRSFAPATSPTRYFPRLTNLLSNTTALGERLPTVTRNLNFRVTVRDNQKGVNSSSTVLMSSTSAAGPFVVISPNTAVSWVGLSTQTVTWDVSGTNTAPVSCANVNIRLSTDGGLTYPTTLATNTQNDGSEVITVPNLNTTTARIMVEAADNYFFDISNTNFTITTTSVPVTITSINRGGANPTNSANVAFLVTFSGNVTGVSAANFVLVTTGSVSGASIASVTGSGTTYVVAVNTGTGSGTLGLNLVNSLGLSPGVSTTLPFVGQVYSIVRTGPVVTSVTAPSNGIYVASQTIVLTVNFNKAAIVNTAGGVPSLSIVVGATTRQALYVGGSGTTGLTFSYTVVPGDFDDDGITIGTLALNGGTIQDNLGNAAVLTLNGIPSTAGVLVDTVRPAVTISSPAFPITSISPILVSVVFSKPVTGFTASDVSVTNGTVTAFSGSGNTYTLNVTPAGAGTVTLNIAANQAQDAAGNGNTAAVPLSIAYSATATTAPVVTAPANNSLVATTTPTYSGTAPVGSTVNVYVDGANIGFTTATGGSFSLVQPTALSQGAHYVYATAQLSGQSVSANSNTNNFTVDTVAPTVTLSSTAPATIGTSPFPVTVLFSEAVADFTASDVGIINGTLSSFTGSGTSYAFNVTPTAPGTVTVLIDANVAHDAAGNGNIAALPLIRTYVPATLVRVLYQNDEPGQPGNNVIRPNLQLRNDGSASIPYTELTMRYWLTVENFAALTTSVNYAELGTSQVQARYVALSAPRQGAFGYVEYSFLPGAGSLPAGGGSGLILSSFNKNTWTNFNETDDYSYATNSTYQATNRITVYRNGILVGGQEPASAPGVNSLKVLAQNQSTSVNASVIATLAQVSNEGNLPVPYSDLTVRYWYTPDGPSPVIGSVDYAALGNANVSLTTGQQGTQTYVELRFAVGSGALAPLSNSGDLLFRLRMANWSAFNQANDYSYRPAAPLAEHPQMTIYRQGILVYGTEPAGASVSTARPGVANEPALTTILESYPNPFIANVELKFSLSLAGKYSLAVYDAQGRLVEKIASGNAAAGELQRVQWQGANHAAGLYLVRLITDAGVHQMKLVKQ